MKLYDINGELVKVDIKPSSYPIKQFSKSKLQGLVGKKLQEKYPYENILEDFVIPGSRLSLDFYLPQRNIAYEIQGEAHYQHIGHFHSDPLKCNFAQQVKRDSRKYSWCLSNNIKLVEIVTIDDMNLV